MGRRGATGPHVAASSELQQAVLFGTSFLRAKRGPAVRMFSTFPEQFCQEGDEVRSTLHPPAPNSLAVFDGISSAGDQSEARFFPLLNWKSSCGLIPMQVGFGFFCINTFLLR